MNDSNPLMVEYEFTRRDYLHFNMLHQLRSPMIWLAAAPLPILVGVTAYDAVPTGGEPLFRIGLVFRVVAIAAAFAVCGVIALVAITVLLQPGLRTLLGHKRVSLTALGVFSEAEFIKAENEWRGIRKLMRGKHYLVMYNTALTAYVIPRRAFSSDAAWDAFYEFARSQVDAARISIAS
jgi:hypothetical protein